MGCPPHARAAYESIANATTAPRKCNFKKLVSVGPGPGAANPAGHGRTWNTRLARVGNCQPPVLVPDVRNDRLAEAGQVLAAAGLTVGQVTNVLDHTCNNIGTVLRQNPNPGTPVQAGSAVRLSIGQRPPPPFQCP